MKDISQFNLGGNSVDHNSPLGATQQGKLIHELREQYEKAKAGYINNGSNTGYQSCHQGGIKAENSVNGNIRMENKTKMGRGIIYQYFKEKNGSLTVVKYTTGSNMYVEQIKPRGLMR